MESVYPIEQNQDLSDLIVKLPAGGSAPVEFSAMSLKAMMGAEGLYTVEAIVDHYVKLGHKDFSTAYLGVLKKAQAEAVLGMTVPKYQEVVKTIVNSREFEVATTVLVQDKEGKQTSRVKDIKNTATFQARKGEKTYMKNVSIARQQWLQILPTKIVELIANTAGVEFGSVADQVAHAQAAKSEQGQKSLEALLVHHQHVAVASLILGELSEMDPVIADASCENRPPFVLDMHEIVQDYLNKNKEQSDASTLARQFEALHKGLDYEGNLSLAIKPCPPAFLKLFTELGTVMATKFADAVEYLGLCVTMSKSCHWDYDEFGTPYDFRDKGNYYAYKGPDGKAIDMKPDLKVRLGLLSCAYMKLIAKDLAANAPKAGPGEQTVEDMLCEVFNSCNAFRYIEGATRNRFGNEADGRLPLLPIYDCFRVILMHEFAKKRPINVIVRRIRKNDKAYTLDDARVIQYRVRGPGDPQAGPSDPKILLGDSPVESAWIADLNPHDSISPCFTIDAFSICTFGSKPMYAFGHDVDSLFTLHSDHYYQKLANCDLFTLMQIYGAAHPPFQSNAIVPKLDQRAYQQLLHWDAIKVDPKTWMDAPLISTVPENATRTDTGGYLMPELMDADQPLPRVPDIQWPGATLPA
jgi:hypothetical protein